MGRQKPLRTRRNGTRYGDVDIVAEKPVVIFKAEKILGVRPHEIPIKRIKKN